MISTNKTFGLVAIECDGCGYEQDYEPMDGRIDFQQAIREFKEYGWIITKEDDDCWSHYCYECKQERFD